MVGYLIFYGRTILILSFCQKSDIVTFGTNSRYDMDTLDIRIEPIALRQQISHHYQHGISLYH